jgi:hypothetical protein
VKAVSKKRKRLCLCIAICMSVLFCQAQAQKASGVQLPTFMDTDPNLLPHHINKDKAVGSPYLTKTWVTGYIELESNHHIPDSNNYVLLNYDKIQSVIYLTNGVDKIWFYPIDSIKSFELFDINKAYDFEKIPWISSKFFLIPIIKSAKGYSLYKRLITNFYWADYSTDGYSSKGRNFDEFDDTYIYYMTYPGNTRYRKLTLKENSIRRDLKEESTLVKEFFGQHGDDMNEQSLLALVQYIDDKKYPE